MCSFEMVEMMVHRAPLSKVDLCHFAHGVDTLAPSLCSTSAPRSNGRRSMIMKEPYTLVTFAAHWWRLHGVQRRYRASFHCFDRRPTSSITERCHLSPIRARMCDQMKTYLFSGASQVSAAWHTATTPSCANIPIPSAMRFVLIVAALVYSACAIPTWRSRALTESALSRAPALVSAETGHVEPFLGNLETNVAMLLGRRPQSTIRVEPIANDANSHLGALGEQLFRSNSQPLLFLATGEDSDKLYAFPLERTQRIADIFGQSTTRRQLWAILAIHIGNPSTVKLLGYAQTQGASYQHIRWALGRSIGSWGYTISSALTDRSRSA